MVGCASSQNPPPMFGQGEIKMNMNGMNGTVQDILAVLTGKTPVQTQSAVTIDPATQQFLILIGLGVVSAIVLLRKK
jgi:hypothetical protein